MSGNPSTSKNVKNVCNYLCGNPWPTSLQTLARNKPTSVPSDSWFGPSVWLRGRRGGNFRSMVRPLGQGDKQTTGGLSGGMLCPAHPTPPPHQTQATSRSHDVGGGGVAWGGMSKPPLFPDQRCRGTARCHLPPPSPHSNTFKPSPSGWGLYEERGPSPGTRLIGGGEQQSHGWKRFNISGG